MLTASPELLQHVTNTVCVELSLSVLAVLKVTVADPAETFVVVAQRLAVAPRLSWDSMLRFASWRARVVLGADPLPQRQRVVMLKPAIDGPSSDPNRLAVVKTVDIAASKRQRVSPS